MSKSNGSLALGDPKNSVIVDVGMATNGSGDADLYVRRGAKPTTATWDCWPYLFGNNETCTFSNPAAGDYYVMLRGYFVLRPDIEGPIPVGGSGASDELGPEA